MSDLTQALTTTLSCRKGIWTEFFATKRGRTDGLGRAEISGVPGKTKNRGIYPRCGAASNAPQFPKLVENNVRNGFLEDGQYRRQGLIEQCPALWFRSLVECGRTYGWRVSELLNMRVKQVDQLSA
jgi:hypothetical protein